MWLWEPTLGGRHLCATQHTDPGLFSCPQVLELLCQILQTDSLSAIQFWLLYAPSTGETKPRAQGVLCVEAPEGPVLGLRGTQLSLGSHPGAFCLGLFSFLETRSWTTSLLPPLIPQLDFHGPTPRRGPFLHANCRS